MGIPLSAPVLDGCVLAVLAKGDAYGYSLTQRMKAEVEISESTLYPVLRRLQREGALQVYDVPHQGRNRRYYAITTQGREALERCRGDWAQYRRQVERLLNQKEALGA